MEQYADVMIDPQGNVVANALVPILDSQGVLAKIFQSNSQISPAANPIRTGSLGEFAFYARNGRYRLGNVSVGDKVFPLPNREILLYDPTDDVGGIPVRVDRLESSVEQLDIEADAATQALDALQLPDYAALRAYKGPRKSVYVTGAGIAGMFVRRPIGGAMAVDNGGTVIVGQFAWDRVFDGTASVDWFGPVEGQDNSAAVLAAARLGVMRFTAGRTYRFNVSMARSVTVFAHGAILKPAFAGKMFEVTGAGNELNWEGGTVDMTGFASTGGGGITNGDHGIFGNGLSKFHVRGVKAISGCYAIHARNCDDICIEKNTADGASSWGVLVSGNAENARITHNMTKNCGLDGIKVAGATGSDAIEIVRKLLIAPNISFGNARDGVDVAINQGGIIAISSNLFDANALKCVDFKVLENSNPSTGIQSLTIDANTCRQTTSEVAISLQDNPVTGLCRAVQVSNNAVYTDASLALVGSGIKVEHIDNAHVFGNNIDGCYYGLRLIGAQKTLVEANTVMRAVRCITAETNSESLRLASANRITRNTLNPTGNFSGNGNCVRLDSGDANEVFENIFDTNNSQYSIVDAGTSSRIGLNRRGTTSGAAPTGNRAVVGEYWEVTPKQLGSPDKWVANAQTSSTSAAQLTALGQFGHRTNAGAPSGVVATLFVGEELLDTTNGVWYKSVNTGMTNWKAI